MKIFLPLSGGNPADDQLMLFSYYSQKTRFDTLFKFSGKSSPLEILCIKGQILFPGEEIKMSIEIFIQSAKG